VIYGSAKVWSNAIFGTNQLERSLGKCLCSLAALVIATYTNLAYPILTLPNQLNIPFPNPSGGYLALAKPRATLSQPQALILVARLLISKVTKIRRTIYWDHYSWLVPNFLTLQMPNLEIYGSSLTRITLTECEFVHPQTLNPLARLCPNLIHLALENPSTVPDDLFVGEVNLINLHLYLTLFLILS